MGEVPACYEVARWVELAEPALDFLAHVRAGGSLATATPTTALKRAQRAHEWTTAQLTGCSPCDRVSWLRVHEYARGLKDGLEMAARLRRGGRRG